MTRMFFENPGCNGVTSGVTGKNYDADRQGFIHVDSPADVANFKAGGYMIAGGLPHATKKFYRCEECDWESAIRHCRWCGSEDLTRVEVE